MLPANSLFILATVGQLAGWSQLSDVSFKWVNSEEYGYEVEIPVFGAEVRKLDGKEITLSGYFMPADMDRKSVVLSKQPFASCYFCGGAGIESIVEVVFSSKPRRFELDEIVTVKGTLHLNDSDYDHLIFIIKEAKEVG